MDETTQNYILHDNFDDDINPKWDCAIAANKFSNQCIPIIIKDDSSEFLKLVSSPEFDYDGTLLQSRERFYLSDYLYQPFFDELKAPTVLCVAAFFKAEKIVECILGLPNVDKSDAFHFACAGGSLNIVRSLFDQADCDLINKDRVRPITIASYFGNIDVVKYLWSHGCPIISPNENNSCINKAAFNGQINILDFFREEDPDNIKKLKDYAHPIISAAKGGQAECIKYLMKYSDPTKESIYSALISACTSGSLSCVKILADSYLNYYKHNIEDYKNEKKNAKRKRKKNEDDEEFDPGGKKSKKKKKNDDNEDDIDDNDEENKLDLAFDQVFNSAISYYHLDVLRYLINLKPPKSMDLLLVHAIRRIDYKWLIDRIIPNRYHGNDFKYKKNEVAHTKRWLQKSAPALKTAEYILMNYSTPRFTDSFFDKVADSKIIDSAIYFLNKINFKVNEECQMSQSQLNFFRLAILTSNVKTIPMIKNILNNNNFNIFDNEYFKPLRDQRDVDINDPNYYIQNDDEIEIEKEKIPYFQEQRIMRDFHSYLDIISQLKFRFSIEAAIFLIENQFPFYILTDTNVLNIFSVAFPFCIACVKLGEYKYARKFLPLISSYMVFDVLSILFNELNERFNLNYDPNNNPNTFIISIREKTFDSPLKFIMKYNMDYEQSNKSTSNDERKKNIFNVFNYKCKNEEEKEIYQQIMSLIEMIIKIDSISPEIALLLCWNGLSKEWIIEQTKNEKDNIFISSIRKKMHKKNQKMKFIPFDPLFGNSEIQNDWYKNSLNPLINLASIDISNTKAYKPYPFNRQYFEVLKFYFYNGIDVSIGTDYNERVWKKVIENKRGWMASHLIKYGKADKNFILKDSNSNELSLFDFALTKKITNIVYVFLEKEFYPFDSIIEKDPNEIILKLNQEKGDIDSLTRETNLKIIALIYKYRKGNYDEKLIKELINELKLLIAPQK